MSSSDRTPDEISADIAETRNRLAGTIDQLVYRAHPKTIVRRQAEAVKGRFVDEQGQPKKDSILKAAGIVAGVLAAFILLRKFVG